MLKTSRQIVTVSIFMAMLSTSCETNSGSGDSITGSWQCREESSTIPFRTYSVNIDRSNNDTTLFTIYNFYDLGIEVETYVRLKDSTATLIGTNGYYNVSGKGIVSKDFKSIEWQYSISGLSVNDNYVQSYYFRK